jgi:hypothetical protein
VWKKSCNLLLIEKKKLYLCQFCVFSQSLMNCGRKKSSESIWLFTFIFVTLSLLPSSFQQPNDMPIASQMILSNPLVEIERIPAERARAGIAGLEPLEQTAGVEHVLASRAALLRQLAVAADDAVADGALGLALEGARDVAAERREAVGDGAVLLKRSASLFGFFGFLGDVWG